MSKLQFVTEGMTGSGSLLNDEVETFDFKKLVGAFDNARKSNPGLSKWALTNGLATFDLGGSDNEALGGDLAHTYGTAGSLAGIASERSPGHHQLPAASAASRRCGRREDLTSGVLKLA